MIKLRLLNVVKTVDSEDKAQRLEEKGFRRLDPVDDVIQEPAVDPLDALEPDELRVFAEEHSIDLGKSTSKDGILEKIRAALN